jgi:uncharacterized protein YjiS (DUF1127 family)
MLKTIRRNIKRWKIKNQTARELSHLTNRELNDIGIDRSEIKDIAKQQSPLLRLTNYLSCNTLMEGRCNGPPFLF